MSVSRVRENRMHGLKGRGWTRTHPTTAAQRWRPTGETHGPYAARLPSNPVRTDPVPYPTAERYVRRRRVSH